MSGGGGGGRCGENITKWHFPRLKIILHFMEYSCTILRAFSNACTFVAIRTRSSARVGFPVLSDPMVQPVPESSSFFRRPSMYSRKYQVEVMQPWRTPCFTGKVADFTLLTNTDGL